MKVTVWHDEACRVMPNSGFQVTDFSVHTSYSSSTIEFRLGCTEWTGQTPLTIDGAV